MGINNVYTYLFIQIYLPKSAPGPLRPSSFVHLHIQADACVIRVGTCELATRRYFAFILASNPLLQYDWSVESKGREQGGNQEVNLTVTGRCQL